MLHIKDIEAFANINEALFRGEGRAGNADLSSHPAILLARLMAAAQAQAQPEPAQSAEVVQLVPASEREAVEEGADSVGSAAHDFDPAPTRSLTMAGLFGRMMFGRR